MNEIMKFDGVAIDTYQIDGVWMFELYAVGMALGYARSNGKTKGEHGVHLETKQLFPYKSRIDKVVQNAEIQPCVHNAHKYITESQIYDFMLEARTDKCRAFRKWLTNEVLPELNHTGSYTTPNKREETNLSDYTYTEKKYKGEAVMSIADVAHFTNLSSYKIRKALLYCHEHVDYYRLKKDELCKFKRDNDIINTSSEMLIVNKGGFKVICNTYGIKIEMPKTFADESNRTLPVKPAEEFVLVLENQKVQKYIKQISDYSDVLKVLLQLANKHNIKVEDWKSKTHDIFDIAIALSGVASQLESARVQTTDKYKW